MRRRTKYKLIIRFGKDKNRHTDLKIFESWNELDKYLKERFHYEGFILYYPMVMHLGPLEKAFLIPE